MMLYQKIYLMSSPFRKWTYQRMNINHTLLFHTSPAALTTKSRGPVIRLGSHLSLNQALNSLISSAAAIRRGMRHPLNPEYTRSAAPAPLTPTTSDKLSGR